MSVRNYNDQHKYCIRKKILNVQILSKFQQNLAMKDTNTIFKIIILTL